jgi:hypothetical protein
MHGRTVPARLTVGHAPSSSSFRHCHGRYGTERRLGNGMEMVCPTTGDRVTAPDRHGTALARYSVTIAALLPTGMPG